MFEQQLIFTRKLGANFTHSFRAENRAKLGVIAQWIPSNTMTTMGQLRLTWCNLFTKKMLVKLKLAILGIEN